MARGPVCSHCEEKLGPKQAFCGGCGHPTAFASHDERVLWDLGQWEVSRRRSASADPKAGARAAESAERTKELFRGAQGKAQEAAQARGGGETSGPPSQPSKRSFLGRARRTEQAEPVRAPASTPARAAQPARPGQAPARPTTQQVRPAASAAPPARANGTNGNGNAPTASRPAARPAAASSRDAGQLPGRARTMVERPAPPRTQDAGRRAQAVPQATRGGAVAASVVAPERPLIVRPPAAPTRQDAPFVVIRKAAPEAAAVVEAPSAPNRAARTEVPAPQKPGRNDRKAAEERRREAERVRKQQQEAVERAREEQRKQAELRKAEQKKEEERRRTDEAKEAKKRERKHRRHSKRVNRRAAELDLRSGERVSLSIEGWSRFRRATLVVTNYRVALVTRMSRQVRWIPLEEVAGIHRRWRGAHSLVVVSPIEVLTLQKAKREMLASFEELLSSEVAEARRPGAIERHHGDITQEWAERSTEIWDSHIRRVRLWIRRHPAVTLGTLTVCVAAAFFLTSIFTSFFSPYR